MRATRKCHYLLIRLSYSVIQIGVTAFFSSKQLLLFARPKQTAVTAQFQVGIYRRLLVCGSIMGTFSGHCTVEDAPPRSPAHTSILMHALASCNIDKRTRLVLPTSPRRRHPFLTLIIDSDPVRTTRFHRAVPTPCGVGTAL